MGSSSPPPLPREHGAWTMLAIPMVLGLAAGGARSAAAWLIPPAAALTFLAHHAIVPWAQRARERKPSPPGYALRRWAWGASYLAAAGAVFACAVLAAAPGVRGSILVIAAIAAALATVYAAAAVFGRARSIIAEMIGLAGVSLTAPMMSAAAGRPLGEPLFGPSVMALGYFLSSVAFVRAYERRHASPLPAVLTCVIAHLAIAAALCGAAARHALPPLWWIAYLPVITRTVWGLLAPPPNLRALGMREIWVALAFTGIASITLMRHV